MCGGRSRFQIEVMVRRHNSNFAYHLGWVGLMEKKKKRREWV